MKQMQNNSHCLLEGVFALFLQQGGLNTLLPLISGRGSTVQSDLPSSRIPSWEVFSVLVPNFNKQVRSPGCLLWAVVCVSVCVFVSLQSAVRRPLVV